MTSKEHYHKLERMYASAPFNEHYFPQIHISQGRAEVTIAVRREFYHAAHAVHGAVIFKVLDDAAFFAVNSLVEEVFVLTVSFNIYFTRPVQGGEITARGEVLHQSKRLFMAESVLHDSNGYQIARGSGTFMPSSIPLSAEIGYG